MPRQQHFYRLNHLHYITPSTHRPARAYDSGRFKHNFTTVLGELRTALQSRIVGHGCVVQKPGDWPFSSWRFYYLGDASLLAMDRVP